MLDNLPISGSSESILRFDHILAVGSAISNYELTEYRLSSEALEFILDWFRWVVEGTLSEDSFVAEVRKEFVEIDKIR